MARMIGPKCKQCRRENMKLFLKGERCLTEKCAIERRAYPPGEHGRGRIKQSEYLLQLREKQKMRRYYGVLEAQFRSYYAKASRRSGITGENFLRMLELRLDNVVYRLGFAASRSQGRQLVRHNHFTVNGKKVNIPSYLVRAGDVVSVREKSRKVKRIEESLGAVDRRGVPQWLELDKEKFEGRIKGMPAREDFTMPIREQLIVELYSK